MLKKLVIIAVLGVLAIAASSQATVDDDFTTNTVADYNSFMPFDIGWELTNFSVDTGLDAARFDIDEYWLVNDTPMKVVIHKTEIVDIGESVRVLCNYRDPNWIVNINLWLTHAVEWTNGYSLTGYIMQREPNPLLTEFQSPVNAGEPDPNYEPDHIVVRHVKQGFARPLVVLRSAEAVTQDVFWMEAHRDSVNTFSFLYSLDDQATWIPIGTYSHQADPQIKYAGFGVFGMNFELPDGWEAAHFGPDRDIFYETVDRFTVGPTSTKICGSVILGEGKSLVGDINEDCYVDLKDFALVAGAWAQCMDPEDVDCEKPWL